MLLSLHIFNWKSHQDSLIQFKKGTNFLIGKMGSGKSSSVDALCFALFGTFPKLSRRECTLKDLKNFNLENQPTKVELCFKLEKNNQEYNYKVLRDLSSNKAFLYCNDKLVCMGASTVTEEIEKIIQINYELFSKAVYCEQNNLDYWFEIPPSKRKIQLDNLLGLDKFESVRSNLVSYLNKLSEELEFLAANYPDSLLSEAQNECSAYNQKIIQKENEISELKNNYLLAETEFKKADEFYKDQQKKSNLKVELEKKISSLQSKISFLEEEKQKIKIENKQALDNKKQALEKSLLSLEKDLASKEKLYKEVLVNLNSVVLEIERAKKDKSTLEQLNKKIATLLEENKTFDEFLEKISTLESEIQKQQSEISFFENQNKEYSLFLDTLKLKPNDLVCPVCHQNLPEDKRSLLISDYSQKIKSNKLSIDKLNTQMQELLKKLNILKNNSYSLKSLLEQREKLSDLKDIDYLNNKKIMLENQIQSLEEEIKNKKSERDLLKKELLNLNQAYKELERSNSLNSDLEKAKSQLQNSKNELNNLNFSEENFKEAFSLFEQKLKQKTSIEEKIKLQNDLLAQLKETHSFHLSRLNEIKKKKEQELNIRKEIDRLKKFENILVLTQIKLRDHMISRLNAAMQMLWPLIYPYSDWEGIRIVSAPEGYLVQLLQKDWKEVETFSSGGERACATLCFRIALGFLLTPSLNWIILDEPTHNLDDLAVSKLAEVLNIKLPSLVKQIIVITHDDRLVNLGYSQAIRFERDKSPFSFTKISYY